eukprot:87411-Pelagomonas_calceolata.AAC.9
MDSLEPPALNVFPGKWDPASWLIWHGDVVNAVFTPRFRKRLSKNLGSEAACFCKPMRGASNSRP